MQIYWLSIFESSTKLYTFFMDNFDVQVIKFQMYNILVLLERVVARVTVGMTKVKRKKKKKKLAVMYKLLWKKERDNQ